MPYPTDAVVEAECLIVSRCVKESGNVQVPWRIEGAGQLMASSATLMERAARINSPSNSRAARSSGSHADRRMDAGWFADARHARARIHEATSTFGQALMRLPDPRPLCSRKKRSVWLIKRPTSS